MSAAKTLLKRLKGENILHMFLDIQKLLKVRITKTANCQYSLADSEARTRYPT